MEPLKKRTIIWEENNEPPKNYIWVKSDGKAYEYNNSARGWELSKTMSSASNGGGNGTDSNASHVYEVGSLEDIQNPKEGDIAIIPDSWVELTIEPTVTEDNGTITKVYNVESYSANSRIRVTSDPTCFASSYVDSENNSHNSGSVSTNVFPVGTKSITLWETGEFPEVHFYEEVPGATKEYVNGEWVDRANFSSAIENMSSEEKMQVRKDLGLYYEETTTGEKTAAYMNEPESVTIPGFAKISNDVPSKDDLIELVIGITHFNPITDGANIVDDSDGYYIQSRYGVEPILFHIVNNNGIYINLSQNSENSMELVYNGPVTTVSKIPEKYLPEIPAGGMPVIRLLKMPPTTNPNQGVTVNITEYFSQEDADTLFNLESCFIVYNDDYGMSFVTTNGIISHGMMGDTNKSFSIEDYQGNKYIFNAQDWGVGAIQYSVQYNPKQTDTVDITQLPTNGMTQQELEGIGITVSELLRIGYGNKRGFKLRNYVYPVISVDYLNSYNLIIEFWTSTDKYIISVDTTMYSILSCTVTSR